MSLKTESADSLQQATEDPQIDSEDLQGIRKKQKTDLLGVSLSKLGESPEVTPELNQEVTSVSTDQSEPSTSKQEITRQSRSCPYLGTINRHVLDFDFEKLCSVTLKNQRPYGCLVCGKYYQGRGVNTHAMMHALEQHHYLFINLHDAKIYCLPDNFEVIDSSLDNIKYHLNPTFTKEEVDTMSTTVRFGKALDGTDYIPGCIGLNNLGQTDYFNVVVQSLCTVIPLRSKLLLLDKNSPHASNRLYVTLGELIRKIYNPQNFKGLVSPHEFLQAVGDASNKRFRIGMQQDPLALMAWLLHKLHKCMRDETHKQQSTVTECFQGQFLIAKSQITDPVESTETEAAESIVPFLFMTLNVPSAPIFRNNLNRNAIPQLPIYDLLQKFDGITPVITSPGRISRYSIWKLPPYLIVHINRFSKNNFFLEKNPTIITFPVKSLDLRDYVHPNVREANVHTRYNLVANTVHEGPSIKGKFKCQVYHAPTKSWYELEDIRVTPTLPQMVALSESYIQIYQRQDVMPDGSLNECLELLNNLDAAMA